MNRQVGDCIYPLESKPIFVNANQAVMVLSISTITQIFLLNIMKVEKAEPRFPWKGRGREQGLIVFSLLCVLFDPPEPYRRTDNRDLRQLFH